MQTPWLEEFRNWDWIPSVIWLQNLGCLRTPCTGHTVICQDAEHWRTYKGRYTYHSSARKERGRSFLQRNWGSEKRGRHGNTHFNPKRQKNAWQKHFLGSPHLTPPHTPFATSGSRMLTLFFSRLCPSEATLSTSMTSTLWWIPNILAQIFLPIAGLYS